MVATGKGVRGWVKKVKGVRSTNWQLTEQSWVCKVQHKDLEQAKNIFMHGSWTWKMLWGMPE